MKGTGGYVKNQTMKVRSGFMKNQTMKGRGGCVKNQTMKVRGGYEFKFTSTVVDWKKQLEQFSWTEFNEFELRR